MNEKNEGGQEKHRLYPVLLDVGIETVDSGHVSGLKADGGRCFELRPPVLAEVEEILCRETEIICNERCRKAFALGIVFCRGAVEEAPCRREFVLDVVELPLQLEKILVRLQIRIGLGKCEQPAER